MVLSYTDDSVHVGQVTYQDRRFSSIKLLYETNSCVTRACSHTSYMINELSIDCGCRDKVVYINNSDVPARSFTRLTSKSGSPSAIRLSADVPFNSTFCPLSPCIKFVEPIDVVFWSTSRMNCVAPRHNISNTR